MTKNGGWSNYQSHVWLPESLVGKGGITSTLYMWFSIDLLYVLSVPRTATTNKMGTVDVVSWSASMTKSSDFMMSKFGENHPTSMSWTCGSYMFLPSCNLTWQKKKHEKTLYLDAHFVWGFPSHVRSPKGRGWLMFATAQVKIYWYQRKAKDLIGI